MFRAYQPCIPVSFEVAPSGPQWVHEIKHDGYRLIVRRTGERVQPETRGGYNWADRYPWIAQGRRGAQGDARRRSTARRSCAVPTACRISSACTAGYDHRVILYAFDLLELDGEDLRPLPLEERKATLAKLFRRAPAGIHLVEHIEAGDGPIIFEHACKLGLEGIVSKRRDASYRAGPCKSWLKIKNPKSPAMLRLEDGSWR